MIKVPARERYRINISRVENLKSENKLTAKSQIRQNKLNILKKRSNGLSKSELKHNGAKLILRKTKNSSVMKDIDNRHSDLNKSHVGSQGIRLYKKNRNSRNFAANGINKTELSHSVDSDTFSDRSLGKNLNDYRLMLNNPKYNNINTQWMLKLREPHASSNKKLKESWATNNVPFSCYENVTPSSKYLDN